MIRYAVAIPVLLLALAEAPAGAQTSDVFTNQKIFDMRNRTSGSSEVRLDDSLIADYQLAQEYRAEADRARRDGRERQADKRWAKAVKIATRVTKREPAGPEGWVLLGQLRCDTKDWSGAEDAFESALVADPESEDALRGLDTARFHLERDARAGDGGT